MLTIVGGPMFAGKTTWLINHANQLPQNSFIVFKPHIDNRYSDSECVSHDGLKIQAHNIDINKPQIPQLNSKIKTVFFDELNFFKPEIITPLINALIQQDIEVIGVGLLYDSQREPFGATLSLSKIADKFIELYAVCDGCQNNAKHSYRKNKVQEQVLLGAADLYGPSCDNCWLDLNTQD